MNPDTPPSAVPTEHVARETSTAGSPGNLPLAVGAGFVSSLIGAGIWAGITIATDRHIGLVAIGIGLLVGFAVRLAGRGRTDAFAVVGGLFALVGAIVGNLFTIVALIAQHNETGFFSMLANLKPGDAVELLTATFRPMDLLFYAIAVYEGFKFARLR